MGLAASAPVSLTAAQADHPRPTVAPAEFDLSSETVTGWTNHLFPETRAGAGPSKGRITRDTKG